MRVPPYYPSKAPPPNTITLDIIILTYELEGGVQNKLLVFNIPPHQNLGSILPERLMNPGPAKRTHYLLYPISCFLYLTVYLHIPPDKVINVNIMSIMGEKPFIL